MKQTAHIEDWRVIPHPVLGKECLDGIVSDHPDQFANSWRHWDRSTTSPLVVIDRENNKAETVNTHYTLGTPRSDSESQKGECP